MLVFVRLCLILYDSVRIKNSIDWICYFRLTLIKIIEKNWMHFNVTVVCIYMERVLSIQHFILRPNICVTCSSVSATPACNSHAYQNHFSIWYCCVFELHFIRLLLLSTYHYHQLWNHFWWIHTAQLIAFFQGCVPRRITGQIHWVFFCTGTNLHMYRQWSTAHISVFSTSIPKFQYRTAKYRYSCTGIQPCFFPSTHHNSNITSFDCSSSNVITNNLLSYRSSMYLFIGHRLMLFAIQQRSKYISYRKYQ